MQTPEDARADIALIGRIVARDEQAVADLYDRHNRLLYGLILRILRDRGESEEVLQEVFLAVWTRAESYNVTLGPPARRRISLAPQSGGARPFAAPRCFPPGKGGG